MSQQPARAAKARIRFQSWDEFADFLQQEGNSRGLFVRAAVPPAIGTDLGVHFMLPDGSELLLSGRVVHTVNPLEAEALGEDPGMGVQFTHMSEEQAHELQRLMLRAMSMSSRPPAKTTRDELDPRLHEAASLLERSRFDAAERRVMEIMRDGHQSVDAKVLLLTIQARRASSQFDFMVAIDKYRSIMIIDPTHEEANTQVEVLRREVVHSKELYERVFGVPDRRQQ